MTEETTTEQLAEIDRDMADIERQVAELVEEVQRADYKTQDLPEYTPPEGWRVVRFGEQLLPGDVWVSQDGTEQRSNILHWDAAAVSGGRCIRRIEPHPQPQPVQVREGQWRTRRGDIKTIRPCEPLQGAHFVWPWTDGIMTFQDNGRHQGSQESAHDLVEYLEPEPEPQPQQNGLVRDVTHLLQESGVLDSAKAEQQIEELRSEVSYVQRLLGESRQRVTQLEELVGSLRTINEAQEKSVRLAGQENTDLKHRLDVVSAEWAEQAATINGLQQQLEAVKAELVQERLERNQWQNQAQRTETQLIEKISKCRQLQIELDALHQAPQAETAAAVPTSTEDRFEQGWDAGTARAVETIAEWLEPIKAAMDAADNQDELARAGFFAIDTIRHLPHIMRSLTGLAEED